MRIRRSGTGGGGWPGGRSGPPGRYWRLAQTVRGAVDDLDTPSAIALLRGLADDDGGPEGAKFETFLYVSRVQGLDLARDIGKPGVTRVLSVCSFRRQKFARGDKAGQPR